MNVQLCIRCLAVFVGVVNGEENILNKLLRDHIQRTAAKTNEMTMDTALELIRVKQNVSREYLESQFYPKVPRSLRQNKVANALQLATDNAPKGYAAVDAAMKMLNKMIFKAEGKYELELSKCCTFDKSQSALMEETRQDISKANADGAAAKKEILEAEASIAHCETQIPKLNEQLVAWIQQSKFEIANMDSMLATVRNDIEVIGSIIEASQCEDKLNAATVLYQCRDECGDYELVDWGEPVTPRMHALALELFSQPPSASSSTSANLTTTTAGPRTITRSRPCKIPRSLNPASAKCTIKDSPSCPPLVEKFYNIQTGLVETQRELETKRAELVEHSAFTRSNLESQIAGFESKLKDGNTALAGATARNSEAAEQSRGKGIQLKEFMKAYQDMTEECHNNYDQLESEICALNKIRGDVFNKLKGTKDPAFFTDCKVSEWVEVEPGCSVSCGGGTVKMQRTIEVYPAGGAACPGLDMVTECNLEKCPINCRVGDWSGWSDCSAKCGGGVQDRSRPIVVEPMYKGDACGDVGQAQACNPQSCDADCVLSDWTTWSNCSKPCNQGHIQRIRTVLEPAIGGGTCADIDGPVRLQKKFCNAEPCLQMGEGGILNCTAKKDLMVMIDGSGSVGKKGWEVQLHATRLLMEAFHPGKDSSSMGIIVFSGPKWLCDDYQCQGLQHTEYFRKHCKKDATFDCGTQIVSHLTTDKSVLETNLSAVSFPRRTTFTSKALAAVESELNMGQKDAEAVVVVMTDGYPADRKATLKAAHSLNKKAKVIWVPITKYAPLKEIRGWAADPENVIPVRRFRDLKEKVVNDVIATSCSDVVPMANPLSGGTMMMR